MLYNDDLSYSCMCGKFTRVLARRATSEAGTYYPSEVSLRVLDPCVYFFMELLLL